MKKELRALGSCNAFTGKIWGRSPKMTPWLYKRVIIPDYICDCRMVRQSRHCFGNVRTGTPAEGRMYYDYRGNENNSDESAGDVLGSAKTWNGSGVCSTDGNISPIKNKSEKLRNRP